MNSFKSVPNSKLPEAKSQAIRLRKKRDREKLTNALKPMSLSENNRKIILANTNNVNVVIKKARNLSTQKKLKTLHRINFDNTSDPQISEIKLRIYSIRLMTHSRMKMSRPSA